MKSAPLSLLFAFLVIPCLAPPAAGQQFAAEEQKVYDQFQEAARMDDAREIAKLARKYKDEVKNIYRVLESKLSYTDTVEGWEELRTFGRALDDVDACNVYDIRMKVVMGLSLEDRQKRDEGINRYGSLYNALYTAKDNQDKDVQDECVEGYRELADMLGRLGEAEYQAYCLSEIAGVLNEREEKLEAVKLWDEVDNILTRAGYSGFKFQGSVQQTRDSLKAQGFDPNAVPGEGSGPVANTGTSWADDPAGQQYSDPIPLKLVVDAKIISKFQTPAFCSGDNPQVWQDFMLQGNGPVTLTASFQPLGKILMVSRDGPKVFIQAEGDPKPREIKVITKPNVVEMEREIDDWQGKKQKQEYAWLAATGGENEVRFGLTMNSAPQTQPPQYTIRYHPACYLKGKVLDQDILIFDDNCSGRFGDPQANADPTSALTPEYTFNDAMQFGKSKVVGPFSEFVYVDGDFYRLKLSPDDYTIRTRKLAVDIGTVTLKFTGAIQPVCVIIEEIREFQGAFFAIEKKPVVVPVGLYRVGYGIIRKGKGTSMDFCIILPGKSNQFRVEKGEEELVDLGAPFKLDFEMEQDAGTVKVLGKTVAVYGKAGELYTHFFDDPIIPDKVSARVKGSSSGGRSEEMKQATFDDYLKEGVAVWQPLDLVIDGSSDKEYEVKLELKKHALLGKKIESAWK